jgi:hypothetical protein
MLDKSISRNIDAQKDKINTDWKGVDMENNLYAQNLSEYKDQKAAEAATRAELWGLAQTQIQSIGDQFQGAQAAAEKDAAIAHADGEMQKSMADLDQHYRVHTLGMLQAEQEKARQQQEMQRQQQNFIAQGHRADAVHQADLAVQAAKAIGRGDTALAQKLTAQAEGVGGAQQGGGGGGHGAPRSPQTSVAAGETGKSPAPNLQIVPYEQVDFGQVGAKKGEFEQVGQHEVMPYGQPTAEGQQAGYVVITGPDGHKYVTNQRVWLPVKPGAAGTDPPDVSERTQKERVKAGEALKSLESIKETGLTWDPTTKDRYERARAIIPGLPEIDPTKMDLLGHNQKSLDEAKRIARRYVSGLQDIHPSKSGAGASDAAEGPE